MPGGVAATSSDSARSATCARRFVAAEVVADTGPLLAAAYRDDPAHELSAALVAALGRQLLVPDPVIVEVDWLLRSRVGDAPARAFLAAVAAGSPTRVALTTGLFTRAVEIDRRHADLRLGLADAAVMSLAEERSCPILTFDFTDFRAAPRLDGTPWRLVVDEEQYRRETAR